VEAGDSKGGWGEPTDDKSVFQKSSKSNYFKPKAFNKDISLVQYYGEGE
jgi:hypothetical protein